MQEDGSFLANKNIVFNFVEHKIDDQNSLLFLDSLAKYIVKKKPIKVDIIGHTDDVGSEMDNQILSEKRALEVRKILITKGVAGIILNTDGKGEFEPLHMGKPDKNRRVTFKFYF